MTGIFNFGQNKSNNKAQQEELLTFANVKNILGKSHDFKYRSINIGENPKLNATLIFIEGVVDQTLLSNSILRPFMTMPVFQNAQNYDDVIAAAENGSIYFSNIGKHTAISEVLNAVISAEAVIIFDEINTALSFDIKKFEKRSISEPSEENVIKGSKDSFIEDLKVNITTIRKKIKNINLVVEQTTIGKQTQTNVAIVFIDGITNMKLVEEVKKRLAEMQIDSLLCTSYIENYLANDIITPFPLQSTTERPDKFCANIVEGRVGLIIDGLPISFIIPGTLLQMVQAPDDYANNFIIASLLRFMRFALMIGALFFPGFYVAVTSFHQTMIPTDLALSIATSEQGVPWPTYIEIIIMLLAFEILTEAGLRMPKTIGQAVSIVGALIVGQAAVTAKLISPAVVIIIAFTAISHFAMPNQGLSNALRLWRLILVVLGSIMGLFGLSIGGILLLHHLSNIESFGVPYLSPFVGTDQKQMQDTIIVTQTQAFKERPTELATENKARQK